VTPAKVWRLVDKGELTQVAVRRGELHVSTVSLNLYLAYHPRKPAGRAKAKAVSGAAEPAAVGSEAPPPADAVNETLEKKPRGRPKGSKSRPKPPESPFDPANPPAYLTAPQVARHLRIGLQTVYDLCARREMAHSKVGRIIRITPAQLAEFEARAAVPAYVPPVC
jgi:excisionase family DNA binding protein